MINVNDDHEARGTYKRFIPNQEVAIMWEKHEHNLDLIEDLTVYRLERTPQRTRVRVVDFALPDEYDALSGSWDRQLKKLKKLYQARPVTTESAPRKKAAAKTRAAKKTKRTKLSKRLK